MPIEESDKYISIRVKDPDLFIDSTFRFITLSEEQGIFAISGKLKADGTDGPMVIQAYRFLKEKWSMSEAEKWVADHKEKNRSIIDGNIRSFESLIKLDLDGKFPKFTGLAVPYNKISDNPLPESPSMKEKISIRAFKRSLEEDDIFLLYQHDIQKVLGRNRAGTLKLIENDGGIYFENVPPENDWVKGLRASINRGDISNMSFKFSGTAHYERITGGTYLQVIDEGRLDEISVVARPVYLTTSVYSRSAEGGLLVNSKPVDIIDPDTGIPYSQDINLDDILRRYDVVMAKNERKDNII